MRHRTLLSAALLLPCVAAQAATDSPVSRFLWTYDQETTVEAGAYTDESMGQFQAPLVIEAEIGFTRSTAATGCGAYQLQLIAKCTVAGTEETLPVMDGTCNSCDGAGNCRCSSSVHVGLATCNGVIDFYLRNTNKDSSADCRWTKHQATLYYHCSDGHFGSKCIECSDCAGCSCHGTATSSGNTCSCECSNHWNGDRCDNCPMPYSGANCDTCFLGYVSDGNGGCTQCTVAGDCNSRASEVTSNDARTACQCKCNNNWQTITGLGSGGCNFCASMYKYPSHADPTQRDGDCDVCASPLVAVQTPSGEICAQCDLYTHCSGATHATAVSYAGPNQCECTCKFKFSGASCAVCPSQYSGVTCNRCATGYINYDTCTRCTSADHCNDHAAEVTSNNAGDQCLCTCRNAWADDPRDPTNAAKQCSYCAPEFSGTDCDVCSSGYIGSVGKVGCSACSSEVHCNGHAANVTSNDARDQCQCTCRNQWSGSSCATCPHPYTGNDCDACPVGYINYPTCTRCIDNIHCNERGIAGTATSNANQTRCVCQCIDQWFGEDCDQCPQQFDQTTCNKCSFGHFEYPQCYECSSARHCSGRATVVAANRISDTEWDCKCTCDPATSWEGAECEVCPAKYDRSLNCANCAPGRVNYPTCTQCTSDPDCNNRATAVTSNAARDRCVCTCTPGWDGDKCERCPAQFEQDGACSKCAAGRISFPTCSECTVDNCGGSARASSATANAGRSACLCTCLNHWDPLAQCSSCPQPFAGANCDACMTGFVGYPNCVQCTSAGDCSNHAASVTSSADGTACKCTCRNGWSGSFCEACNSPHAGGDCETCVEGFANGPNCDACAVGHYSFPTCAKCELTMCSGRGVTVTSNADHSGCECTCTHSWGGSACETCPPSFAVTASNECDGCAAGHVNYPTCRQCTQADCGGAGKALTVSTNSERTQCVCTCVNKWDPTSGCSTCPSPYTGAACDECAPGFHSYPDCLPCTNQEHCSNRADSVTSAGGVCQCTCGNKWDGASCGDCPSPFGGADCNACLPGRINFPACAECTNAAHCNTQARSVATNADATACVCSCLSNFDGPTCGACAAGHINYPTCTPCTPTSLDCKGKASATKVDAARDICVCDCQDMWVGDTCETCDSKYDQNTCARCGAGRVGYPDCRECTVADCGPHTHLVVASGDQTKCYCVCKAPWSGPTCEVCQGQYTGDNCDKCAAGFSGTFPECGRCTSEDHCSGRALGVSSTTLPDGTRACVCACRNNWQSGGAETAGCTVCPPQFAGDDCDRCTPGHIGANCDPCTPDTHCSGHANPADVTDNGDGTSCVCKKCLYQWTGSACETCPPQFDSSAGCMECAAGHVGYPSCRPCSETADCSGNARSVKANDQKTECVCECRNRWSGADCSQCVAPYSGTDCETCATGHFWRKTGASFECVACTNAGFCGGNALEAIVDTDGAGCRCACPPSRTGSDCSDCARGYFKVAGECVRCTVSAHCSGHAVGVEAPVGPAQDVCTCQCVNKWSGDDCSQCVSPYSGPTCQQCEPGRFGFPTCEQCGVQQHCSGHASGVTSDPTGSACVCSCDPAWSGDATCSTCTAGHAGPTCEKCTNAHFNDRCLNTFQMGASVDKASCVCGACRNQWQGDDCGDCPSNYAGADCDACAAGYVSYPSCVMCTVGGHCAAGADQAVVATDGSGCDCVCRNHWSGLRCGVCTSPYAGADCDRCEDGSIHLGGSNCEKCDVAQHCSGHAHSVVPDPDAKACVCTCRNKWTGTACDECAMPYGGSDCQRCADGYIGFPNCVRCDIAQHCSQRASSVSTDQGQSACLCTCEGVWMPELGTATSPGCSQCPSRYTGDECDRCGPGRAGFPVCGECTLEDHCHNHALAVSPSPSGDRCICACANNWQPPTCVVCPLPYGGANCAGCADGYVAKALPALTCTECTVAAHCSGHARSVTADATQSQCVCNCLGAWEGTECEQCPPRADGPNCDRCAPGRVGFPSCTACTTAACHEHAVSATANADQSACVCVCRNQWTGAACDECAAQHAGADCDKCAPGRISFPECNPCRSGELCKGHGEARSNQDQTACECVCDTGYTGSDCGGCSQGFLADGGSCRRDPGSWCTTAPPAVDNGLPADHCAPTIVGGSCVPHCVTGHSPEGAYECNVGPSGATFTSLPSCVPSPCDDWPPAADHVASLTCSIPAQSGASCTVQCEPGYTNTQPFKCEMGSWSQVAVCEPAPCDALPSASGSWSCSLPVADGGKCTLACPSGHSPTGEAKCERGTWTQVTCEPDSCDTLPPPVPNSARSIAAAACRTPPSPPAAATDGPVPDCKPGSLGVAGAGDAEWDGCYEPTGSQIGGADVWAKDSRHQVFKAGESWVLGDPAAAQPAYRQKASGARPAGGYETASGRGPAPNVGAWDAGVRCAGGSLAVHGAGADAWNGCYAPSGSLVSDGMPIYEKDGSHQVYRWGGQWRLGQYGVSVAYVHMTSGQAAPPQSGYSAANAALAPSPTVEVSTASSDPSCGQGGSRPCPASGGADTNGGCSAGSSLTFEGICVSCGVADGPRCRTESAAADVLQATGCHSSLAHVSGWCRACGGEGQPRCPASDQWNGGCQASVSLYLTPADDGTCVPCGAHNDLRCLCTTPPASSPVSVHAALFARNAGCRAGHAPSSDGSDGRCFRCGAAGQPKCLAAGGAAPCDLPVASGGTCTLTCGSLPSPQKCSPTHETDLSDGFVTLDASADMPVDHNGDQVADPVGPICFEWVAQEATRAEADAVCRSKGGYLASIPTHAIETHLHSLALAPEWWLGLTVANQAGLTGSFDAADPADWWNAHYNDRSLTKGECCKNMRPADDQQLPGNCMQYNQGNIPDVPYQASDCLKALPFWCMYWDDARTAATPALSKSGDYECNAGQWSQPECVPKKCDVGPPTVAHGSNGGCSTPADEGVSCPLTCDLGFTKTADHKCKGGIWVPGQCSPRSCATLPDAIPNGKASAADCVPPYTHGTMCQVHCDAGHTTPKPFVCRAGVWEGPTACVAGSCTTPPPAMVGGAGQGATIPAADKTVVAIACSRGKSPDAELQCSLGQWVLCKAGACSPAAGGTACVPASCGAAPVIAAAAAAPAPCTSGAAHGTECDVQCDTGFRAVGGKLSCDHGSWKAPTCEPLPCASPATVDHGTYSCRDILQSGETCELLCDAGYEVSGQAFWKCSLGQVTVGSCQPKQCTLAPQMPQGGTASCALPAAHGSTCSAKLGCRRGRVPTGDFVCNLGEWQVPDCSPAACSTAPPTTPGLGPVGADCERGAPHGGECAATCVSPNQPGPTSPWKCVDGQWQAPNCAPSGQDTWLTASCCSDHVPRGHTMRCDLHVSMPSSSQTAADLASGVSASVVPNTGPYRAITALPILSGPGAAPVGSAGAIDSSQVVIIREVAESGGDKYGRLALPTGWVKLTAGGTAMAEPTSANAVAGTAEVSSAGGRTMLHVPYDVTFATEGAREVVFSYGGAEAKVAVTAFALTVSLDAPAAGVSRHWVEDGGDLAATVCDPASWLQGKAYDGWLLLTTTADTAAACCARCQTTSPCKSWTYKADECILRGDGKGGTVDAAGAVSGVNHAADSANAADTFSGPPRFFVAGEAFTQAADGSFSITHAGGTGHPVSWSVGATVSKAWGQVTMRARAVPAIADEAVTYSWTTPSGGATSGHSIHGRHYADATTITTGEWFVATAEYPSGGACWRAVSAVKLDTRQPSVRGTVSVDDCGGVHAGAAATVRGTWTGLSKSPDFTYSLAEEGTEEVQIGAGVDNGGGQFVVTPAALPLPSVSCVERAPQGCSAATCGDDYSGWCPTASGTVASPASSSGGVCCTGFTATCLACKADVPKEQYCTANPSTPGCAAENALQSCCADATAACLACQAGQSTGDYCAAHPATAGCATTNAKPDCQHQGSGGCGWPLCSACNSGASSACEPGDYVVTGAGSTEWNGCYKPTTKTVDGRPRWEKDATHHLYRYTSVWRLAEYGIRTYYEHIDSGLPLPPVTGYFRTAGANPAPEIRPGGGSYESMRRCIEQPGCSWDAAAGDCQNAGAAPTHSLTERKHVQDCADCRAGLCLCGTQNGCLAQGAACVWSDGTCWPAGHCARWATVTASGRDALGGRVAARLPVAVSMPTKSQMVAVSESVHGRINQGPTAYTRADVISCNVILRNDPATASSCKAAAAPMLSMLGGMPSVRSQIEAADRVRRLHEAVSLGAAAAAAGGASGDEACCSLCENVPKVITQITSPAPAGCPSGSYEVAGAGSADWNGCYLPTGGTADGHPIWEMDKTHHIYRWGGKWRLAQYGVKTYYVHSAGQLSLPPSSGYGVTGGQSPAPTVVAGGSGGVPALEPDTTRRATEAMLTVLNSCGCGPSCSSRVASRKAAAQQVDLQTNVAGGQQGRDYIDNMHKVLASSVRAGQPGTPDATTTFKDESGRLDAFAVSDAHTSFRGGRDVGTAHGKAVFHEEELPFGSPEANKEFEVSAVAALASVLTDLPNPDFIGERVYSFKIWDSATGQPATGLSGVEVTIVVTPSGTDAERPDAPLRALIGNTWSLPGGCTDLGGHTVRCPVKSVPSALWTIRHSAPRAPTPAPTPSPATPNPPSTPAPPVQVPTPQPTAPGDTPYPPGSVPVLTPEPAQTTKAPVAPDTPQPPGLAAGSSGSDTSKSLVIILVLVCVVLLGALCTLAVLHWRKKTLSSLSYETEMARRPGKLDQMKHAAAGTGLGYDDLQGQSPADTGSTAGSRDARTGGSAGTFATAQDATTEPTRTY